MNKKILIIDDDPQDTAVLKQHLSAWGHDLVVASNGQEGLDIIEQEKIDLVLLDAVMPEMDGFEVCKRIKTSQKSKFIPVLMVTSLNKDYRLLAINLGADEFLTKPVDKVELIVRVSSLLKMKALHDEFEEKYRALAGPLADIKNLLDTLTFQKDSLPEQAKEKLLVAIKANDLISRFINPK